MVRAQPDYGIYSPTPVAAGIADPGEAAARLGSINVYDRRGQVVWLDDFEAPLLKWLTSTAGGGVTPTLATVFAWMGIQSCFLSCGAFAADRSTMFQFFPLIRRGKVGIEFFTYLKGTTPAYLGAVIDIYDGTNHSYAELRLDNNARTASILTPVGVQVIATDIFPLIAFETFLPVKIVVDMDSDKYVRLLIGPDEFDISAHELIPIGATTQKLLTISIFTQGGAAGIIWSNIDNFILTQNEP